MTRMTVTRRADLMISVRINNEILSRIVEIEKCREKFGVS